MEPLICIHADESCLGNRTDRDSPGGAGGLVEVWKDEVWHRRDLWICDPATTNNRMALAGASAILNALKKSSRIIFFSDSSYLVNGLREWTHSWARRGWTRKSGPIENLDLWKALTVAVRRHEVDPRWVRGHAGDARNEYVDHLATRAAKKQMNSHGLVASGFVEWLEKQRETRERFLDYFEHVPPPEEERFDPIPPIPG
jgi:ribonuclease HI